MFKFAIGISAIVLASCAAAPAYAGEVEDKDASLAICRSEMKIRIDGMSDSDNHWRTAFCHRNCGNGSCDSI